MDKEFKVTISIIETIEIIEEVYITTELEEDADILATKKISEKYQNQELVLREGDSIDTEIMVTNIEEVY